MPPAFALAHAPTQDLNVGVDVVFYGKVFRLCDADKFTKDFLESEGIAVNPAEPVAEDPYTQRRVESLKPKYTTTPSSFDKLRQFIEMDRKVLRFWAVWDDTVHGVLAFGGWNE